MEDDWDSHDNFLKEGNTEVCYSGLFFISQNNLAVTCSGVLENSGAKKIFFEIKLDPLKHWYYLSATVVECSKSSPLFQSYSLHLHQEWI